MRCGGEHRAQGPKNLRWSGGKASVLSGTGIDLRALSLGSFVGLRPNVEKKGGGTFILDSWHAQCPTLPRLQYEHGVLNRTDLVGVESDPDLPWSVIRHTVTLPPAPA